MTKKVTLDIGIMIDLLKLMAGGLFIEASSNGGKSVTIRKIMEAAYGKVHIICMDTESEYASIRTECENFLLVGDKGDIPLSVPYTEKLCRTIMEKRIDTIIDLYDLEYDTRIEFVKRFCIEIMKTPADKRHPVLLIIDEAQIYAPEDRSADSLKAIMDVTARGRKRGIRPIFSTQNVADFSKKVLRNIGNRLIGLTTSDVDMVRAAQILGIKKADMRMLMELEAGEFFAYGPAISKEVKKFRVELPISKHPEPGTEIANVPPAKGGMKTVIQQFSDLPKEAQTELNTIEDYKIQVESLTLELEKLKDDAEPAPETQEEIKGLMEQVHVKANEILDLKERNEEYTYRIEKLKHTTDRLLEGIENLKIEITLHQREKEQLREMMFKAIETLQANKEIVFSVPADSIIMDEKIRKEIEELTMIDGGSVDKELKETLEEIRRPRDRDQQIIENLQKGPAYGKTVKEAVEGGGEDVKRETATNFDFAGIPVSKLQAQILNILLLYKYYWFSEYQISFITGNKPRGGHWTGTLRDMETRGLITRNKDKMALNEELPEIKTWIQDKRPVTKGFASADIFLDNMSSAETKFFHFLRIKKSATLEDMCAAAGVSTSGGNTSGAIRRLVQLGLIKKAGKNEFEFNLIFKYAGKK